MGAVNISDEMIRCRSNQWTTGRARGMGSGWERNETEGETDPIKLVLRLLDV